MSVHLSLRRISITLLILGLLWNIYTITNSNIPYFTHNIYSNLLALINLRSTRRFALLLILPLNISTHNNHHSSSSSMHLYSATASADILLTISALQDMGYPVLVSLPSCSSVSCIQQTLLHEAPPHLGVQWNLLIPISAAQIRFYRIDVSILLTTTLQTIPPPIGERYNILRYIPIDVSSAAPSPHHLSDYDVLLLDEASAQHMATNVYPIIHHPQILLPTIRVLYTNTKLRGVDSIRAEISRGVKAHVFTQHIRSFMKLARYSLPPLLARSNRTAVIVEGSVNGALDYVVRNALHYLGPGWALHIYHTKLNGLFIRRSMGDIANIRLVQLRRPIRGIPDYNRLLKSSFFWNNIDSDKVLVFQTDSIILRSDLINYFLRFDYIGAPWDLLKNQAIKPLHKAGLIGDGVGNGGFSLRNGRMMAYIASRFSNNSSELENEDVFFVKWMVALGKSVMPLRRDAYTFCREVPLFEFHNMERNLSHFALHAAWYYSEDVSITTALDNEINKYRLA